MMYSIQKIFKYKLLYLFSFLILILSCKDQVQNTDILDNNIEEIKKDVIHFSDGTSYQLDIGENDHVYYLLRHAEKDTIPKNDPALSELGNKRAAKLSEMFRGTRIDAFYSTLYMRTISTVDSLARAKGMGIKPYDVKTFKETYNNIIDSTNFKRIMIVGHSNSTPVVANYLYGENYFNAAFEEDDYDNLIVVIARQEGENEILPLKFSAE